MQLIVAVVQEKDAGKVLETLVGEGHRVTKISTSGGFLGWGNTTILAGVEDKDVDLVLDIFKKTCHPRTQYVHPLTPITGLEELSVLYPLEVTVGGATIMVLPVERYERL
jgi:uncharacterized protein YaaQ